MEALDHAVTAIEPRTAGCLVPLTPYQQRWWKHQFGASGLMSEWRLPASSVRILGPLDSGALQASIEAVVRRHESLRTRIVESDGHPRQHIDDTCDEHFAEVDLTRVHTLHVEEEAKRLGREFIEQKVDLSIGPLFDSRLLRLSRREHVLVLGFDHILSDATSYGILSREIWSFYNQAVTGTPPSLPPLPVQFGDFAIWQQRTHRAWLDQHEAYWAERLVGAPRIQFPHDDPHSAEFPSIETKNIPLGKALSAGLRDVARRESTLLPLVVLTLYATAILRWTNQRDFVVGFISHGRHGRPELKSMIGLLAYPLLLRIQVNEQDSLIDLMRRIDREFRCAFRHQDYGRVPDLIPECSVGLFFNWISGSWSGWSIHGNAAETGELRTVPLRIQSSRKKAHASFRLSTMPFDSAAGIVLPIEYRSDLFSPTTMQRFSHSLRLLAAEMAERPHVRAASVTLAP